MNLEELEKQKDDLHLELRELLLERDENQLSWTKDGIPTSKPERDELNAAINETKLALTQIENQLRQAKRDGRMRFSEALASICMREGHESYIEEAKTESGFEP